MQMSAHTQHGTPYRAPALSFPSSQHSEQRHIPLDAISTVPSSLPIYRGCRSRLQPRLHQAAALCTDWHWHIWGKLQGQTGANSILLPIPSLPLLPELCTQRGSQTKTSRKCPKKKPLRATQAVRQHQGEGGGLGGGMAGDCSWPCGLSPTAVVPQPDSLCAHRPGGHTHAVSVSSPSQRCDNLLWKFFKGKNLT